MHLGFWRGRASRTMGFATVLVIVSASLAAADDRGVCFDDNSPPEIAIDACTKRIASGRLNSRDLAFAFDKRGNALTKLHEYYRAIDDYRESIRRDRNFARPHNGLCWALTDKSAYELAIPECDYAIQLAPGWNVPYLNRAHAWREKGEFNRAIADYTQAIRLAPADGRGFNGRAWTYHLAGRDRDGLRDAERAVQLAPNTPRFLATRGHIYERLSQIDKALADFDLALSISPNLVSAHEGRGLAYEKRGDRDRAISDFNLAISSRVSVEDGRKAQEIAREHLARLNTQSIPAASVSSVGPPPVEPAARTSVENTTLVERPQILPHGARSGRRVALVIGNSLYRSVPVLQNPTRDAEAIAHALRSVGFQSVTLAKDLSREKLVESLRAFASEAENADWAMVYYAGHGIEMNGINYVIPIDAKLTTDHDVEFEALPLDQFLSAVESAKALRLVLLDACRDNPFAAQMRRTAVSRTIGRGLASIEPSAGTLVVYSAKHGQIALDGEGNNSPFVTALMKEMTAPGLEINKLFRLVRDDVLDSTGQAQEPFTYGSLSGREDFFFVSK